VEPNETGDVRNLAERLDIVHQLVPLLAFQNRDLLHGNKLRPPVPERLLHDPTSTTAQRLHEHDVPLAQLIALLVLLCPHRQRRRHRIALMIDIHATIVELNRLIRLDQLQITFPVDVDRILIDRVAPLGVRSVQAVQSVQAAATPVAGRVTRLAQARRIQLQLQIQLWRHRVVLTGGSER
jgi:hypothetical protein